MHDMRVFDANCTVYRPRMARPPLKCFVTPEELLEEMDFGGVDEALIAHFGASVRMHYMADVNQQVLDWVKRGTGRLHGCWVFPITLGATIPDIAATIDDMVASGVKAVRLWANRASPGICDDWVCGDFLDALERRRIPVFLFRTDISRTGAMEYGVDWQQEGFPIRAVRTICRNHPDLPVVMMWVGGSPDIVAPLLRECPNLRLDFPCLANQDHLELYLRVCGAERLLYGSGLPWINPAIARVMINYSTASVEEKRLMLGDNLRRLLGEVRCDDA